MYRIKLTNGTVLEFDSLESLTVDIHAEVVDADALIFHQRANQWLPIHVHPVWKQALAAPRKAPPAADSAPHTDKAPATRPASPSAAPRASASASAKPSAPSPRVPVAGKTSTPMAQAGSSSNARQSQVSVDHLDEELELLSLDDLKLPGSNTATATAPAKPVRVPRLVRKAAPAVGSKLPAADFGAASAAAPAAPQSTITDVELESALELLPEADAAADQPVVASAGVPAAEPPTAQPLPPNRDAADTLVSSSTLLVEPAVESVVLEESAPGTVPVATEDLASEIVADAAAVEPAAETPVDDSKVESAPVAAPAELQAPVGETDAPVATSPVPAALESLTLIDAVATAADHAPAEADHADTVEAEPAGDAVLPEAAETEPFVADTMPLAARPAAAPAAGNRKLWYAGGAAAAAAGLIIAAIAMRGDASASATSQEPTSANPGIPGAPLAPQPASSSGPEASETPVEVPRADARSAKPVLDLPVAAPAETQPATPTPAPVEKKVVRADPPAAKALPAATEETTEILAAPADLGGFAAPSAITVKFDVSPNILASHYVSAQDAAWNDLVARLRVAGFDNLFTPARTAPSGASSSRAAVAAARTHIAQWRTRSSAIEKAYRDSASALAGAGSWDAAEQRQWDARAKRSESGESAQQVNAILNAADRLFGILTANKSAYEVGADGLRFTDSGAQRDYWETRRNLVNALAAASKADARTPLALVLKAAGSARPPEGTNVN